MRAVRSACLGMKKELGWALAGMYALSDLLRHQISTFGQRLTLNRQATGDGHLDV